MALTLPEDPAALEAALRALPREERRRLLTLLVKLYSGEDADASAVDADELTADDVAIFAAALLRSKEVTTFELAALFNV